jgi:hypothetical protein
MTVPRNYREHVMFLPFLQEIVEWILEEKLDSLNRYLACCWTYVKSKSWWNWETRGGSGSEKFNKVSLSSLCLCLQPVVSFGTTYKKFSGGIYKDDSWQNADCSDMAWSWQRPTYSFCSRFAYILEPNPDFLNNMWHRDEVHTYLKGVVDKQKCWM